MSGASELWVARNISHNSVRYLYSIFDNELYDKETATSANNQAVPIVGHEKVSIEVQDHGHKLIFGASDAAHLPDEDVNVAPNGGG